MAEINWASERQVGQIADWFADAFARHPAFGAKGGGSSGGKKGKDELTEAEEDRLEITTKGSEALQKFIKNTKEASFNLKNFIDRHAGRDWSEIIQKVGTNVQSSLKYGIEAGSQLAQEWGSIRLGTTINELNELNAKTRLVSIAMGGYSNWTNEINKVHQDYFNRIGDTAEATKFIGNTMQLMGESGLKPTMASFEESNQALGKFGMSLKRSSDDLYKLGIRYEESSELLKASLEDENVRTRLRGAANEEERKAIIQGIGARNREFRMLGMMPEQIKKANAALDKMSGKGPLDRFKAAAKAQASLTAMGIEGADKVADFIRAGDRATEQQRIDAAAVMGEAKDVLAESRQGGFGQELAIDIISSKGGLKDLSDSFSTKLSDNLKVSQDQLKALDTVGTTNRIIDKSLRDAKYWSDITVSALENSAAIQGMWKLLSGTNVMLGFLTTTLGIGLFPLSLIVSILTSTGMIIQSLWTGTNAIHDWLLNFDWYQTFSEAIGSKLHWFFDKLGGLIDSVMNLPTHLVNLYNWATSLTWDDIVETITTLPGFIFEKLKSLFWDIPKGIGKAIADWWEGKDKIVGNTGKTQAQLNDEYAASQKAIAEAKKRRDEENKRFREEREKQRIEAQKKKEADAQKDMEEGVKKGNKELVDAQKEQNQYQKEIAQIQKEKWEFQKKEYLSTPEGREMFGVTAAEFGESGYNSYFPYG